MPYLGNTAGNRFVASKAATQHSGDGSTTVFPLDHAVGSDEDILVSVDGVIQEPSVAYAVSNGTTLTFTAAPSSNSGNNIFVYYLFRTVATVDHPSTSSLQATDGTFTAGITGTLQTAAQTNITSVGTLTSFTSTGIDDNADATAITIDSTERVLINKTSTDFGVEGVELGGADGKIFITRDNTSFYLNRLSSDGNLVQFYKDSTEIGSIGVAASDNLYIAGSTGSTKGLYFNDTAILPATTGGGTSDNAVDLGQSNVRYKDLYLSSGVFLGGTGSANELTDYEEGTWSPYINNGSSNLGTSNVIATYTKIGRTVYAEFQIQRNDSSSDTNYFYIAGLPFTSINGPRLAGQAWIDNSSNDIKCFIYLGSNSTTASFPKTGGNDSAVSLNEFSNARYVYGALVYNT